MIISLCKNIFSGLQSHASHHPCPYYTAARYDDKGKKTVVGDWGEGDERTPGSIRMDNWFWLRKGRKATKRQTAIRGGGGKRKNLEQFNNCQNVPIRLKESQENTEVLLIAPPDPLHCVLLGPCNDVFRALYKMREERMIRHFLECGLPGKDDNKLYGGNFLGTHLKVLLKEENLDKLSDLPDFEIIKEYLISLDKVHILSTGKKLPPQQVYHKIMEQWREAHKKAVEAGIATSTPKCHIIGTHFQEYFDMTGETLYYADTSNVEAVHSALRISEETHGSRTTRNLGSDEHISRLKRSAVEFSSMNLGYIRRTKVPRRFAMDPYSELSGSWANDGNDHIIMGEEEGQDLGSEAAPQAEDGGQTEADVVPDREHFGRTFYNSTEEQDACQEPSNTVSRNPLERQTKAELVMVIAFLSVSAFYILYSGHRGSES